MTAKRPHLPIDDALPDVLAALKSRRRLVLQAPPGAGKTTRVPLAVLESGMVKGRILVLEPRRLAARATAERMSETRGEKIGQTIGYRMRGDTRVGNTTRIEVVTEGILTRMIQSDPELVGIGAVIFDEFHERSLHADLGLAFCLEIAGALREDLALIVMSATIDTAPIASLMDNAPVVTSPGRSFPVETRWLDRPLKPKVQLEAACADLVKRAVAETSGGLLVFLPGEGEIRRCAERLTGQLPEDCQLRLLYGALPFDQQRAAVRPESIGRKVVLATSIAETSLTIEDIRIVVDAGRARRARFDPGSGMSRLVTEKVSRAEATQRTGRAGRIAEGLCYRLWSKGEEGALPAFAPAEIEIADLARFALEIALWGGKVEALPLLTPPNPGSLAEARNLLQMLGALDRSSRITDYGRGLAALPLHPRLAHMLAKAGREAALLAALLADRDPLRGAPVDLLLRLRALRGTTGKDARTGYDVNRPARDRIKQEAARLRSFDMDREIAERFDGLSAAQMAALAYPDRIGLRRKGEAPRYVLSGGKGAVMDAGDPLAANRLIVVTATDGNPREARIRLAVPISEAELRGIFADRIIWQNFCAWSKRGRRVNARQQECFGRLILQDRAWTNAPDEALSRAMLDGVRELGLQLSSDATRLVARVHLARESGLQLPDFSEPALIADLENWLLPHIGGVRSADDWKRFDVYAALLARLSWDQVQALNKTAPASFITPLGRKIPIDYSGEHPEIALRIQEMFGQTAHPRAAGRPLRVTLLSPAQRPVQTTMDIQGFWETSYADVRRDMRGRYPRHPWPEDPRKADPTLRTKQRGG